MRNFTPFSAIFVFSLILSSKALVSQTEEVDQSVDSIAAEQEIVGKVTGYKIPRYVSMKVSRGRVRRGPDISHRIDWIFTKVGLPLLITDEVDVWRQVRAVDGSEGWMHQVLLSGARFIIVTEDMAEIKVSPSESSTVRAKVERDLIARVVKCKLNWCQIRAGGYKGWLHKSKFWGVAPDEILE